MKLIHTGDLHLGKRVHEQLMLEEQSAALDFIAGLAEREHADAVAIAGDIYDRSVPPVEAARLFDDFITRLSEAGTAVIAVITIPPSGWGMPGGCSAAATYSSPAITAAACPSCPSAALTYICCLSYARRRRERRWAAYSPIMIRRCAPCSDR